MSFSPAAPWPRRTPPPPPAQRSKRMAAPDAPFDLPSSLRRRQDGTTISDDSAVGTLSHLPLHLRVLPPNDDLQPWYSPHPPSTEAAKYDCQVFANNNNVTCFPPAGEEVYQHQWAAVVCTLLASYILIPFHMQPLTGNSRRPQLTQFNLVNLYLYNADTQEPLFSIINVTNPTGTAGQYNLPVNDSWFGTSGTSWQPGQNMSYPFFWIVTNQNGLDGSQTTNPTFFAVRTSKLSFLVLA